MINRNLILLILLGLSLQGCRNDIWYSVSTKNLSSTKGYDHKMEGWNQYVVWGGHGAIRTPVPDVIFITWKTVKPEKKGVFHEYDQKTEAIYLEMAQYGGMSKTKEDEIELQELEKKLSSIKEPEDVYDYHKVKVILKDKVPKRPTQGNIRIEIHDNEQVKVQYIANE